PSPSGKPAEMCDPAFELSHQRRTLIPGAWPPRSSWRQIGHGFVERPLVTEHPEHPVEREALVEWAPAVVVAGRRVGDRSRLLHAVEDAARGVRVACEPEVACRQRDVSRRSKDTLRDLVPLECLA